MRETTEKPAHLKINQTTKKKQKPQFRLRITTDFHVPTSLRKKIHLLQVKKGLTESHLCAFIGMTRNEVRGTVETAKPVLKIWAQKLQSSHASLQQKYCLWSVFVVHLNLLEHLLNFWGKN